MTLAGHEEKLPAKDLRWDIQDIANACIAFYRPLLEAEMELLDKQGYLDSFWQAKINQSLRNMDIQKNPKAFILRLDRHSGAEAMTLNGVRNVKIMQGKNEKPKYEKESKTVWLAAPDKDARTGMIPFGWVLVNVDSAEGDSGIGIGSASNTHELRSWRAKTAAKIAGIKTEHEKRIAAQRAHKEREQREEQENAKRKQIFEEKLQSLTPLSRELETQIEHEKWETDKNAFWTSGIIESWLTRLEEGPDASVIERLSSLFDRYFPGARKDPDKTQGKKQKPVFGDRVRQVAKALNALRGKI